MLIRIFSLSVLISAHLATAQTSTPIAGMGDSLTEGVQSFNSSTVSQPHGYLNLIAGQMGANFTQPLILSGPLGNVETTLDRARLKPSAPPADLGVSGATTESLLTDVATPGGGDEIDLVLPPFYGLSQLQIAQQLKPQTIFCWSGSNDLIGYVEDFNTLNDPTVTPLTTFISAYQQLVSGLKSTGAQVVLGNIPDVTKIGYVFDNAELQRYAGSQFTLPAGYYTTLPTAILLHLGVYPADVLTNPAYVLSPDQISMIRAQVQTYNRAIAQIAGAAGFPVTDVYSFLENLAANPISVEGVTITTQYNGGGFSLDGIHPSDFGYALFANQFISTFNQGYGQNVPLLSTSALDAIAEGDPFIDWNGNGVVRGRPFTGLLESIGPIIGVSGDLTDHPPAPQTAVAAAPAMASNVSAIMRLYFESKGMNPETPFAASDVEQVFLQMFRPNH